MINFGPCRYIAEQLADLDIDGRQTEALWLARSANHNGFDETDQHQHRNTSGNVPPSRKTPKRWSA